VSEQGVGGVRAYAKHRGVNHNAVRKAIAAKRISRSVTYVDRAGHQVPRIEFAIADQEWARNTDPTAAEKTGKFYGPSRQSLRSTPVVLAEGSSPVPEHAEPVAKTVNQDERANLHGNESVAAAGVLADAPSQAGEIPPAAAGQLPLTGPETSASSITEPILPAPAREGDPNRYLEHRARTEEFKAKQAELEYLKDLGRLVSAAEVREAQFRRDRTLRDKLLNVPDRIATIVAAERDPARVHQQMTDEIKRILNELSIDAAAEVAGGAPERVAA
jgi:hypothetical protein